MVRILSIVLILHTSANLLAVKKDRKDSRIAQRRKSTKPNEKKFADPTMFEKFKKDMQSGALKGLIRPVTPATNPYIRTDQGIPPRIQKARYANMPKIAPSNSIQFADWTQRFNGASRTSAVNPTPANRYGPRGGFLKDSKSFGRQSSGGFTPRNPAGRLGQQTQQTQGARFGQNSPAWNRVPTTPPANARRFPMNTPVPNFGLKLAQPAWTKTMPTTTTTTRLTTPFNMCLNGGIYQLGVGCLCVGNFAGDFCDECVAGWNGDKCDNPQNLCAMTAATVDCSSRWLFNLTLLNMPVTAKNINMEYNGLIKSGAFRKKIAPISGIESINLKGNYFARFPLRMFANQPALKILNVASNFLFALPTDIFNDIAQVQTIDFKNNNIKALDMNMFENNSELEIADFSNNNLGNICKGIFAYQSKLTFVAFNRNDDLALPLNKWFGTCPYDNNECDTSFPQSQYGGPVMNLRRRIGAFGETCN